ncbi:hypothetical protein LTR53_011567, partial [Teratosphaeriaceae sp. CCFEE 6253]
MDTDISAAPVALSTDPVEQSVAIDAITKGGDGQVPSQDQPASSLNEDSFVENSTLDTTSFTNKDAPMGDDSTEITPTEGIVEGIQPVADFIPKDAPNHSHPTPPPDPPLETTDVDGDVAMTNGDGDAHAHVNAESTPAPIADALSKPVQGSEPSLVRPREDDAEIDEERAPKRSRMELDGSAEPGAAEPEGVTANSPTPMEASTGGMDGVLDEPTAQSAETPILGPGPQDRPGGVPDPAA